MDEQFAIDYSAIKHLINWKRYKEALMEAEKLLQRDPENPQIYAIIGWIYLLKEDYEKSLSWSDQALARDPEHQLA